MMRITGLLLIGLALLSLAACDPNRVFEKNVDIPDYVWNYQDPVAFEVAIEDTTAIYNLYVNVRHTNFYPFSNMWVMVTTVFPDGETLEQRLDLELADKDGKWFGDCLGDICDVQLILQEKAYFNQVGTYTFRFNQIMRMDDLPAVMSMGLRVEKAGERPPTATTE